MTPTSSVRAPLGAVKPLAFAALPHALRGDPRLNTRAIVTAATLLAYARDKPSCWPSIARLAADMRCSEGTARNGLRALRAAGWIAIRPAANPTGRIIVLTWRGGAKDWNPGVQAVVRPGVQDVAPEASLEEGEEEERPGVGSGREGPPPPAGAGDGEAPASPEEIADFRAWAAGPDPVMARFGRAALKLAGLDAEDAPPCPATTVDPARCRPGGPGVRGATAPGCHGLRASEPLGTGVDRPPGPGAPPPPGAASPWERGTGVPIAPGTPGPSPRGSRAPRPSGTSGDRYLGSLALGLGGALGRESRGP